MSDIVKLYNPANASSLTFEEIRAMQDLTSVQIKELAEAYPNKVMQRGFLLIIDKNKPAEKQLAALSTFENLWNLREKNGLRQFIAFGFKGNVKPGFVKPGQVRTTKKEVLDLSETELMSLPGFKTQTNETLPQDVAVKKLNKKTK